MVYNNCDDSMPISLGEFERIVKAEGREEGKTIMAKRMLEDGMSYDVVAKYTELSVEELKKLMNGTN
ncbi:hypothetical protein [Aquibacillus salsiterrae]|uniref:Transposase n=1 Tax=Aquibacillus salsiterrae TaxID=2950439 RepID=A0A9X3WGJ3_9BACI|nr:hypothetical protein [Aquibacillus salsiterrae]MDC3416626.1 hypothetical protein [Aquibacillus salsiterrae]